MALLILPINMPIHLSQACSGEIHLQSFSVFVLNGCFGDFFMSPVFMHLKTSQIALLKRLKWCCKISFHLHQREII